MEKIYNVSNMSVMVAKWSRNYKLLLFTLFALSGLFGVNEKAWGAVNRSWNAGVAVSQGKGTVTVTIYKHDWWSPDDESERTIGSNAQKSANSSTVLTATDSESKTFESSISYRSCVYTVDGAATGYSWLGWYDGSGNLKTTDQTYKPWTKTKANKNESYYAKFSKNSYDVTLAPNGGSGSNQTITATFDSGMPSKLKSGSTIVKPTKTGYTFTGYFDATSGGTKYYNADLTSARNWDKASTGVTLYAQWSANEYTITLTAGAGTTSTGTKSIKATFDASTNLTSAITTPTKNNNVFDGYYTGANGTGKQIIDAFGNIIAQAGGDNTYTDADKKWKYAGNIELHANWIAKYDFEITGGNYKIDNEAWNKTEAFTFVHADEKNMTTTIEKTDVISYNRSSNTITALKIGTSKITFKQNNSTTVNNGTIEFTITVDSVANTLAVVSGSPFTRYVGQEITSVRSGANSNGTITTSSSNPTLAHYDIANNKIVIPNSDSQKLPFEDVTITISQAATAKYKAKKHTITLKVQKYANILYANNSTTYKPTMRMGKDLAVTLTATNTDYTGSPIQLVAQTAGDNTVAVFDYTQNTHSGTVHSKYKKDVTATWSIHQDENYKYLEANGSFSVDVTTATEANCYVLEATDEKSYGKYGDASNTQWQEFSWTGTPDKLKFKMWKYSNANDIGNHVYVYDASGNQLEEFKYTIGSMNTTQTDYTEQLPEDARKIRIQNGGGTWATASSFDTYVSSIYVTRKIWLNASDQTIDKTGTNNPVYPSAGIGVGQLVIDYSLASGGDLKIYNDNAKFTLSQTTISNVDCKEGSATIDIQYQSKTAGTDYAHLVIYNDVYRKEVTLTGITAKRDQAIEWIVEDALRKGTTTANAAVSSIEAAITYTSDNPSVIEIVDNKLYAKAEGSANITAKAQGTTDYNEAESSKTITVTNDEIQRIVWDQTFLRLKLGGSPITLDASAYSDVEGCITNGARPITYGSANESVVRIINTNQLEIVGAGTTVITATQAGGTDVDGHKYMSVSKEKTVIVRDPSTPCDNYLYIQPTENEWYCGWNHANRQYKEFIIDNLVEPSDISLQYKGEYKTVWGVDYFYGKIHVEEWYDNAWHDLTDGGLDPAIGNYQTFSHALNRNTTKVRISTHDGVGYHYFNDCKIGQLRYIETNTLNAYEAKVGQTVSQTLSISYDNIVGDVNLTLGHEQSNFTISQDVIKGDCGDRGTVDVTVSYKPDRATQSEVEVLTISDETTTTYVNLSGSATVTDRYITWEQESPVGKFTVESVALTATALTTVGNDPAGDVFYSLGGSSPADIGTINGTTLTFAKDGIAYVTAQGKDDARYSTPVAVTKTFNVSKTPTTVDELPTTGTIYGGTAANDVVLTGGSAKNTVNNGAVTGSFKVTSPATLNAGTYDLTIEFTPEDENMYTGFTTTLENVEVSQITPEAGQLGVTVDDITCGQRIDEASLTNTGSMAGTWYWVDEEANHATPVAGTYDDLNVYFVPSNTNYATVNSTVSVKVNKLETLNVPVALSFCAGESETFRGTEYTEAGEYNVPATGLTRDTVYNVTVTVLQPTTGTDSKTITLGDSESWNGIDLSGYAVGSHEVEYHTTNAVGCDSTVTLSLTVNAPIVNEYVGTGDWNEDENWSSGSKPEGENPDIIVTGTLVVKDTISVGSLTIKPTGGVVIIDKGVLVVNDATPEQNDGYGDLRVADDGALQLNEELKVRDFTLDAKLGDGDTQAASGQVDGSTNLQVNGVAYFQMSFDPAGAISYGWYDFTVPFSVNINGGISRVGSSDDRVMVSGTDFLIMEADEANRANGGKGWRTLNGGSLVPGKLYTITFNYQKSLPQNTFRFAWNKEGYFTNSRQYTAQHTEGSVVKLRGWNGMGNGMLRHGYIESGYMMQAYDHTNNKYDLVEGEKTFAVGSAFFIQVPKDDDMTINWTAAEETVGRPLFAPKREVSEVEKVILRLRDAETDKALDVLYMSASEEATEEYAIGRDFMKMGTMTESKVARMWATKGGNNLCCAEAILANDVADMPISLFTPNAGLFAVTLEQMPADANLYLTYNDEIIWDLTASQYQFELTQGTTEGYGLRVEVKKTPAVTTGVEDVQGDEQKAAMRKVLIDNKVYIVTPEGKMYNIIGKSVKY